MPRRQWSGEPEEAGPWQVARLRPLLYRVTPEALVELGRRWDGVPGTLRRALKAGLSRIAAADPRWPLVQALGRKEVRAATVPPSKQGAPASAEKLREPVKHRHSVPDAPSHVPFWLLAGAGVLVFLGWLRAAGRAARAVMLAACLAGVAASAQEQPRYKKRYPDLEKLLEEANLVEKPVTALKLARLATTPKLMARLVIQDEAAEYLAFGYQKGQRHDQARLYGFFLALHVNVPLDHENLSAIEDDHRHEAPGHAAVVLGRRLWPDHLYWQTAEKLAHQTSFPVRALAMEVLSKRMPLDVDILQEVARLGRDVQAPTPAQLGRLAGMWHRLDASGREYLQRQKASLPPILARTVELKGIPAGRQ